MWYTMIASFRAVAVTAQRQHRVRPGSDPVYGFQPPLLNSFRVFGELLRFAERLIGTARPVTNNIALGQIARGS